MIVLFLKGVTSLIPKGGKSAGESKCLIYIIGKPLEHLVQMRVQKRMQEDVDENQSLSDTQFGFRKGKSTVQAIEHLIRDETCPK